MLRAGIEANNLLRGRHFDKKSFLLQIRGAGQIGRPGSPGLPGPKVGKVCIHAPLLALHSSKYKKAIWVILIVDLVGER